MSKIPSHIRILLRVYALGLVVFTLFRILLLINERDRFGETESLDTTAQAMLMGLRFDTVILCYILALPFLLLSIGTFMPKLQAALNSVSKYFIITFCSIAFAISAADIPYFKQFFSRLSITALEWMDSPKFVLGMIVQEPKYWLFVIPSIIITWFFIKLIGKILSTEKKQTSLVPNILFTLLGALLLVVGMRGRLAHKSPIRVGTAYFSQSAFLNQVGLNANFTLLKSYLLSKKRENMPVAFMSNEAALATTRDLLHISTTDSASISRWQTPISTDQNLENVVLILMESMSAYKMGRHGNPSNLTPFLDSLSRQSVYYPNAYSAGIHTFNGIFSSIFSLPAIYRRHPMKTATIQEYDGLFEKTKEHNYHGIYFCTHDGQFDNVEGFLTANLCDEIIAADDYPSEEIKSTLGVPDDYMFSTAVPKLTEINQTGKPFASVIMTASDHGPYYVPPYFTPQNEDIKQQIVEYADWSLQQFFEQAKKEPWYENTLFVLVADHGAAMQATYDMPLSYNHVPLLFYAPSGKIVPEEKQEVAGQIDIFPTIMDYLHLPFQNNTLGINLNDTLDRPYIYFNGDDKYGVIDHEWYLIQKEDGTSGLYRYRAGDLTNYAAQHTAKVDSMRRYTEAQLQVYQDMMQ